MAFRKYRAPQLLSTLYPLNNSFSKIALIGLENSEAGLKDFEPVVRISGTDFQGYALKSDTWSCFKMMFDEIDGYFAMRGDELVDTHISIPGYTIKYVTSYQEKAIEVIPEKKVEKGEPSAKRRRTEDKEYVPVLVLKRVTFERLKDLSVCFDFRIEYLSKIKNCIDLIYLEIVNHIKNKFAHEKDSQIQFYSHRHVRHALRVIDSVLIDNLDEVLRGKDVCLQRLELYIIVNEISILGIADLTSMLNEDK